MEPKEVADSLDAGTEEMVDLDASWRTSEHTTEGPKHRFLAILILLTCCSVSGLLGWGMHRTSSSQTSPPIANRPSPPSPSSIATYRIAVDVQGDVHKPGVVYVNDQARVQDAIQAAGGLRHSGDAALVNEAELVTDGQEILVPGPMVGSAGTQPDPKDKTGSGGISVPVSNQEVGSVTPSFAQTPTINLNTATIDTLETLPDIGPSRAARIVAFRRAHGSFSQVSDLRLVGGIGATIFGRIAPFLYVGGGVR